EAGEEVRVFEQERVGGENGPVLGAEPGGDVPLGLVRLERGGREGGVEPGDFAVDLFGGDPALRNAHALRVEDEGRPDGHAGGDGDAAEGDHPSSKFPVPGSKFPDLELGT